MASNQYGLHNIADALQTRVERESVAAESETGYPIAAKDKHDLDSIPEGGWRTGDGKDDHDLDSIPEGGWRGHGSIMDYVSHPEILARMDREYGYEKGHVDQAYENALGEENEHLGNCSWIYGNCNCPVENGGVTMRPLTKNGAPDMRYKSNKNEWLAMRGYL